MSKNLKEKIKFFMNDSSLNSRYFVHIIYVVHNTQYEY